MYKIRDFIQNFCEEEKFRILNFIPVIFGTGICLYFGLDNEPNIILSLSLLIFLISTAIISSKKFLFYPLIIFTLGFFTAQLRTITINTPLLEKNIEDPIRFFATIDSCDRTESGLNFIVKNANCPFKSEKIFLTWKGSAAKTCIQNYAPGDRISVFALLAPLSNQYFPESYDFKKQQYFNRISARGFILSAPKKFENIYCDDFISTKIEQFRHDINQRIEKYLTSDEASIAKAITTGTKTSIRKDLRENFVKSGTAHVLAISGLHMGIIGLFIFGLFRLLLSCFIPISMFCNVKKISAIISLVGVIIYYFISGCSVSSLRALIMHSLVIVGILCDRKALTMRSVAIAATIILLISPEVIMFPSFQLSFSAVIAIVAFYEKHWNFSSRFKLFFNMIATTIVASFATSFFSVFVFNQLTLNSIFANIFVIPLMTFFIMPTAIISLIFLPLDFLCPLKILELEIGFLIKIVEYSSSLPGSLFIMPTPSFFIFAVLIFSGLFFTLIHHKIRFFGLFGILISIAFYFFEETSTVVIAPNAKAFGIKVSKDLTCFNHCGYFKGSMSAWTKSVGCTERKNLNSKACRKFFEKIDENSTKVKINEREFILTYSPNFDSDLPTIFLDKNDKFIREIYIPSLKEKSNRRKNRPWNR